MSDFDIQKVKEKLEQDLKNAANVEKTLEKDVAVLEKKMNDLAALDAKVAAATDDAASGGVAGAPVVEEDEDAALEEMQAELDDRLNRAAVDFATKE